jgi:Flp pilus assembly protein TadD/TolB-like protein
MSTDPGSLDADASLPRDDAPAQPNAAPKSKVEFITSSAPPVIRRRKTKPKDRYVIERLIGQGGMGAVYKARDLELDRVVALKLLHPTCSLDFNAELRLKRELVLASKVSHSHVVRVYDFGEMRGTKFISMAFIDGENLKALLMRDGRLPVARAVHIAVQLCEALDAAHTAGVVHRDLKPQNILLDCKGRIYISDFGLARSLAESDSEITRPGERPGSPAYMSPEQALGLPVDHRSDLYSVGLILYELVTGKIPAAANSSLFDHERFRCRIKSPTVLNPEVSANLAQLILRCLEFDPIRRYQSAADLLSGLKTPPTHAKAGPQVIKAWLRKSGPGAGIAVGALSALAILLSGTPRLAGTGSSRFVAGSPRVASRLALLPFRAIGDEKSLHVFADSLTEAISSRAGEVGRMRVFLETGATGGMRNPSSVDVVITGSVREARNEILTTIHVIDGASGEEKWTHQFWASPKDLANLEARIWAGIANCLGLSAAANHETPALLHATKNLDAYKLNMQGRLLLRMHRNALGAQQAIPLFEQASRQDLGYFYPFVGLADASLILLKQTHNPSWLEKAKQAASRAQDLSPNRPEAQIQVARIQIATGQYPQALKLLENALEMSPASDEAYRTLGKAQLLSGLGDQAVASFQKAIELDPQSWINYNGLGVACLRLGRTNAAERAFRRAIELAPQINDNYTDLGNAYLQSGRFQEAVPIFERAVELEPDAINYSNLATALFYLHQYQSAVVMFQKTMRLDPKSEELTGNLADAYRWSGQKEQAIATYFQAVILGAQELNLNPRDADTRGRMAMYYAKMGDFESARASIASARELAPKNGSLQYFEAVISTLAADIKNAKEQLRSATKNGYSNALAAADPELRSLYSGATVADARSRAANH